ncbi:MAG: hypothetical protein AAFY26_22155 [Cyanobacteria bacterium J06638_22]
MTFFQISLARSVLFSTLGAWLLANIIGGSVANFFEIRLQFLGELVLTGGIVGIAQAFVFRPYRWLAFGWGITTAIAWVLANSLEIAVLTEISDSLTDALVRTGWFWEVFWLNFVRMAVVLMLVAIPQAVLLWRYNSLSWVWIPTNIVAGAVLGAAGATACFWWCDDLRGLLLGILLGSVSWGSYALVTGPVLFWLGLRSPTANR